MSTAITPACGEAELVARIRLADGRLFSGALTAGRQRRIHLGLLHADSDGYVEIAAGRRAPGAKLRVTTRKDPGHFLAGGGSGAERWLDALLEPVERHAARGEEVFAAAALRRDRGAGKAHVSHTRWLWLDVDGREGLPALRALLRRKPAHLVIESGSGGVHAYWRLDMALRATAGRELAWLTGDRRGDAIEAAHERIIYALGYRWQHGRPVATVADAACKDRSRLLRLAGTINGKSGAYARILWADLALAPWALRTLIGDLPAAPTARPAKRGPTGRGAHDDPYKRISPVEYFQRLAGIEVPARGLVSCHSPTHGDSTPSCHVADDAAQGWCCFGCGAAGAIYDLASLLLGGPTGRWLRGSRFNDARELVQRTFGEQ